MKTNKEFFLDVLKSERKAFRAVLDALPEDKLAHKVHDRSREAGNIAAQLAVQWKAMSGLVNNGSPDFNPHDMDLKTKQELLVKFDECMDQLEKDVAAISDEKWENEEAAMGNWKGKKFEMVWGFLFDAIHHRGQLSTFLRNMGAKVPNIYGPTADFPLNV